MKMWMRFCKIFAGVALSACCVSLCFAQSNVASDVVSILRKAQSAPQKLNFSGTFVYQQGNQIRTSRVTHILDASGELEKLEILDGRPREYIRHNDVVSCYLPDSKTIQIEKQVSQEVFPSLFTGNPGALLEGYSINRVELNRVAGVDCEVFGFVPKDHFRYGYRLCIDKSTGLLLRAQTINEKNEVIEQIAFTQLQLGDIDRNRLKPTFGDVSQWHVENVTSPNTDQSGWQVKALPPGFKKTQELKRLIAAPNSGKDAKTKQEKANQAVQLMFSDGLATISVFIEPDSGSRTEGSLQQGAMTIMGKRQGDYWLTVVGEVPFAAIKQVINSIEFKPK